MIYTLNPSLYTALFNDCDRDGSGKITEEEFTDELTEHIPKVISYT